jgi:hypothetical protein
MSGQMAFPQVQAPPGTFRGGVWLVFGIGLAGLKLDCLIPALDIESPA